MSDISDEPMAPKPVHDTRGLSKPNPCDGEERNFSDWRVVFESWGSFLDGKLSTLMHKSAGSENPIPISMNPGEELRQRELCHIFVQLVKGKAFRVIRVSPAGRGLEAWRLLVKAGELVERWSSEHSPQARGGRPSGGMSLPAAKFCRRWSAQPS